MAMNLASIVPDSVNLFKFPKLVAETSDMERPEWLKLRKDYIGGSEAAGAAGLSRYASPVTIFYDKTQELSDREASERMEAGNRMEPVIAHWFAEKSGKHVVRQPFFYQHPKYPFMGGNIDFAIYGENALVEIKNTTNDRDFADGYVPDEYFLQTQHYMAVTGADRTYLVYLLHGWKLEWIVVERDEAIIDMLIEKEADLYYNYIVPRIPPKFDGTDAAKDLLKRMYPSETNAEPVDLPDDIDALWSEHETLGKQASSLQKRKTEIENQIKAMLADSAVGLTNGRIYTYKTTERKGYVVNPTSYRQLRSSVRKEALQASGG